MISVHANEISEKARLSKTIDQQIAEFFKSGNQAQSLSNGATGSRNLTQAEDFALKQTAAKDKKNKLRVFQELPEMSGEQWVCRTPEMLDAFVKQIKSTWDWSKPLALKWSAGVPKSMGQLALCHVWIRSLTDYVNARTKSDHDEDTMKTCLKRQFGIRIEIVNPITGKTEPALKSLSRYEKGEMFGFMQKLDQYAASIGCVFPYWGEYETLRKEAA